MNRSRALVLCALLASGLPVEIQASHSQRCPDGTYVVDGPPIFPGGGAARDAIVLDHGTAAIASGCGAVPGSIHKGRDGTTYVRASWRRCDQAWRVHLMAKISPDCRQMSGVVVSGRPSNVRRFIAHSCNDPAGCGDPVCRSNQDCPTWAYCARPQGNCGIDGRCADRPGACPNVWLPVCGCDGRTYGNACQAASAGTSVAHEGSCDQRCDVTNPCDPGSFCELPTGICASALDAGMCVDVPEICPQIYQPVCGCDGVTYANECERRKAGVSKSINGSCLCPQILCAPGTEQVDRDGDSCAESCLAPCTTGCDCKINPNIRLNNDCPMLCPTCGDHWTCQQGHCVEECGPQPPDQCRICGGLAGFPCRPGEVCDLPPGQCHTADLFGLCKVAGDACLAIWDPVCGCDGRTWGNDCERLRAGAQLDHRGACLR